jgi:predicted methyltransferase
MKRFTLRQLAAITILAASASLTSSFAQEASVAAAPAKPYTIPAKGVSDAIRKAVQDPARPANMVARDGWRRPAEVLSLAQLKPGQTVVELSSFPLYYAPMLSSIVGEKGKVLMYDFPVIAEQYGDSVKAFSDAHKNTEYKVTNFTDIEFPRGVDVVFSVHAFHLMLLTGTDFEVFHSKLFKAMKPGAIYLIIDHAAIHGTETNDTARLQRIDPGVVRAYVQAAGFQMIEDSRILENTDDTKKWPVFEDGKLDQTDQMVYKFRKPSIY